jgi:hypothetical protein
MYQVAIYTKDAVSTVKTFREEDAHAKANTYAQHVIAAGFSFKSLVDTTAYYPAHMIQRVLVYELSEEEK